MLDLLAPSLCQDSIPQFHQLVAYNMAKFDLNKIDLVVLLSEDQVSALHGLDLLSEDQVSA